MYFHFLYQIPVSNKNPKETLYYFAFGNSVKVIKNALAQSYTFIIILNDDNHYWIISCKAHVFFVFLSLHKIFQLKQQSLFIFELKYSWSLVLSRGWLEIQLALR